MGCHQSQLLNAVVVPTIMKETIEGFKGEGDFLDHYLGKGTPDWQGSFGTTLKFRNFSLSTLFEYKTGNFSINNLINTS